jgi:hypothetical protein
MDDQGLNMFFHIIFSRVAFKSVHSPVLLELVGRGKGSCLRTQRQNQVEYKLEHPVSSKCKGLTIHEHLPPNSYIPLLYTVNPPSTHIFPMSI